MMRPKFIYLHGFGSSPCSSTVGFLKRYYPQYEWVVPELNHHCSETLDALNALIQREQPTAVIGTSLGGFYSLYCDSEVMGRWVKKLAINPALYPSTDLRLALGENKYLNPRKDGVTNFRLEEVDLDDFASVELTPELLKTRVKNVMCIFSMHDELLNYGELNKYLFGDKAFAVESIGHRLTEHFVKEELGLLLTRLAIEE
ncbi:MAG: YqiA/YcfP family alpha/beta fold hydrolase [Bacteroidales bacterium]